MAEQPYNPLDKVHLGESVAKALLAQPVVPLPPPVPFRGAGIYALYYIGSFPPYRTIAARNVNETWALPIYVGKAVPAGARQGGYALNELPGEVLYRRLREHAESIQQVANLHLEEFRCRYLVVDDIWIPLGESLLISTFTPLWNYRLTGFGNHPVGGRRVTQQRSAWDVVHPGRLWAAELSPHRRSLDEILRGIGLLLEGSEPQQPLSFDEET